MKRDFENRLKGGHPNSLGNTIEIVEEVLKEPVLFDELFSCYFSEDEVVRLRVSNAMKRICKANKSLLIPYLDKFLDIISKINQPSAKWTLSQLFDWLMNDMTNEQKDKAVAIMKYNLETEKDWIVQNMTMETLGKIAEENNAMRDWLIPKLEIIKKDKRKSVAKKASQWLEKLI